jgi:basic membrane protein A and related proteins
MLVRLAAAVVVAVVLASCGGEEADDGATGSPTGGDESPAAEFSVGLALPGPIDDAGFNQGHYEGVQESSETHGFEFTHQDNLATPEQITDALRNLASTSDLVIAAGGQFVDPLTSIAPQFSDVQFVVTAGFAEGPNIHAVVKNWAEQSYVAGVLAATMTQTKKVGFIGGLEIPPTIEAQTGFEAGVGATDSTVEVAATTIGTFNDPALAKEAASAQLDAGADVIQGFVDAAEPGVSEAVQDAGGGASVIAGGHEIGACELSDDVAVVTPAQTKPQVTQAIDAFVAGDLGAVVLVSLATLDEQTLAEAVQLCPGHEDEELQGLIDETITGILDGSITVPTGQEG